MSLNEVREVWKSGNTFGSTVDGLEEFGSCFMQSLCSFMVGDGGGNVIQLGESNVRFKARGGAGQGT